VTHKSKIVLECTKPIPEIVKDFSFQKLPLKKASV